MSVSQTKGSAASAAPDRKTVKSVPTVTRPIDLPQRQLTHKGFHRPRRKRQPRRRRSPALRFTPTAWAKLLFLRDFGPTEVGGFGITPADDLLLVEDVELVRQSCSAVSVAFDDSAVAELFDEQVDDGRRPEQFARIWLHTHPADSARPSPVDERTFRRVFGRCDWSVMFILAVGGERYARLQFAAGPGGSIRVPVRIDWSEQFPATDPDQWAAEYEDCVRHDTFSSVDLSVWDDMAEWEVAQSNGSTESDI